MQPRKKGGGSGNVGSDSEGEPVHKGDTGSSSLSSVESSSSEEEEKPLQISDRTRFILNQRSKTMDMEDPYWKWALIQTALSNSVRLPEEPDAEMPTTSQEVAEVIRQAAIARSARRARKNSLNMDPGTTDVFDAQKYQKNEEVLLAYQFELHRKTNTDMGSVVLQSVVDIPDPSEIEKIKHRQKWFNNINFQRENHEEACRNLGIPSLDECRLPRMYPSASLRFWQPVAINALAEISERPFLRGAILGDAMGLGKTWEATAFILHVSIGSLYKAYTD